MRQNISIVVPTLNEEGNIALLVERVARAMRISEVKYELIFIDDHSTDGTRKIIQELAEKYPITFQLKQGAKGKAQSLLEGFGYAKYKVVAMLDADLQYPPEVIPEMLTQVTQHKADIVIARRSEQEVDFARRLISFAFRFLFVQLLHGISYDAQSGLKVFRKEIVERLQLRPSPWSFDLEFLLLASEAGYRINEVDITFQKRHTGHAKIQLVSAIWQIGLSALRLRFTNSLIIPFHPATARKQGKGFHYKGVKFVPHTNLAEQESAFHRLNNAQLFVFALTICLLILALLLNWHATLVVLIALITLVYFSDLLFNLLLIYRSFTHPPEIEITADQIDQYKQSNWPRYTILCPLYREWDVVPQFVTAMSRLDYPKERLQILLLLEADDRETLAQIKKFKLPPYFAILVVPDSIPKTKPKALNYGLSHVTGDYVAIYDAEDIPDPLQLKKAVLAFARVDESVICLQAKLNFYNPHQNFLTRLFAAEYALWFDLILTGLQSVDAPIPLGGTSNHFRVSSLHKLQGWDAFNVTEDCDLGIRLVKKGFKTAIISSTTFEEANSQAGNWLRQRTRWIKGYLQTYFVHMRTPYEFQSKLRQPHLVVFQLIVGGKVFSMMVNPLMWLLTIGYFMFRPQIGGFIESLYPQPIYYMGAFSLIFGNFLYLYYYMIGCAKRGYYDIIKYVYLVPFYWLGMSVAAWRAVVQTITQPHYWEKTIHGLYLEHQRSQDQAQRIVGKELIDRNFVAYPAEIVPSVS